MQVAIVHEGNFELYKRLPTGTFLQGSATTTMHFTPHSKDTIMVVAVAQTKSKDYIVYIVKALTLQKHLHSTKLSFSKYEYKGANQVLTVKATPPLLRI